MGDTTLDFKALAAAWRPVEPCGSLEAMVARAKQAAEDTSAMAEGLRFSAWLNTLRAAVDRELEAAADCLEAARRAGLCR